MANERTIARGLGYLSIGLGLAQVLAPRWFSNTIGVRARAGQEGIVRLVGARELVAAAGLLTSRNPAPWLWMRVAGDVMDLALLGRATDTPRAEPDRIRGALAGTMAVTAVDVLSGLGATVGSSNGNGNGKHGNGQVGAREDLGDRVKHGLFGGKPVRKSITIGREPGEVYGFWRRLENLPRFMRHLETVTEQDARRSHWVATAPVGTKV
jgi:hypothetical protein